MDKKKIKDIFCYGMTLAGVFLIFILTLLILYGLYTIKEPLFTILFPFIAAFIIAYLLNPLVEFFSKKKIPRTLGILIIYAAFFLAVALLSINIVPSLVKELQKMMDKIPWYTSQIQSYLERMHSDYDRFNIPESIRTVIDGNIQEVQDMMVNYVEVITDHIIHFFSHIFLFILVPLLVFYILKDLDGIKKYFMSLVPVRYKKKVGIVAGDIDKTMGAYIRSQFLISLFVGSMVYIGLLILDVEFALILAIVNGITNIIPYFGPIIGAIPAFFVALIESPLLSLKVIIMIIIIQQLENHILAPTILGKNLQLHPVSVILALVVGGTLFGFLGLIFAVPILATIRVVLKHIHMKRVEK